MAPSNTRNRLQIPAPFTARDVLVVAINQGALDDLNPNIRRAAYDPNTKKKELLSLLKFLGSRGIDFSKALEALIHKGLHHCARCHRTYYGRNNGPGDCVIYHKPAEKFVFLNGLTTYTYPCCGIHVERYDKEECFRGFHTPNPDEVDYTSINASTCLENFCKKEIEAPDSATDRHL